MSINSREVKFKFIKLYKQSSPVDFIQKVIDDFYQIWHGNSKIRYYLNLVKEKNSFYNIKISVYNSVITFQPQGIQIYSEGNPKYDKLFELTALLVENFLKNNNIEYLMIAPKERFTAGFEDLNYLIDEIYYDLLENNDDEDTRSNAVLEIKKLISQFDFILNGMKLFDDKIIELIKKFNLKFKTTKPVSTNIIKNEDFITNDITKRYFEKGTGYFELGMYNDAIEEFMKVIDIDKNNMQALLNIGWINLIENATDIAEAYFEKVLKIDKNNANALNGMAVVHLRKKNIKTSKKYFIKSVELDSKSKNAYFAYNSLGEIFLKENSIEDAMLNFEKAISINSEKIEAHLNLAHLYHYLGIYDQANIEFESCLKLKPYNKSITVSKLNNLAQKEISKQNLKEAEKIFKKILNYSPDEPTIYNSFGNVLFKLNKIKRAIIMYKQALTFQKDYDKSIYNLGVAYEKLNDYTKAKKYFNEVLNLKPKDKYALNQLGWLEYLENNYTTAIDYFLKAINSDENFLLPVINLGWIYVQENELTKALHIYQSLSIKYPDHLLIKNDLGVVYYKLKIFDKALDLFKEILIKTDYKKLKVMSNYYIGLIYKEKGGVNEAISYFEKAYKLDETHLNTLKELKLIYKKIGENEKYDYYEQKYNNIKHNENIKKPDDKFDSSFEESLKI